MNLVDVEFTFDVSRIIFYFTAEGRVDFRELVKDLASVFRTRIELRQIGVRDEARMVGGIGCCGRPLCCASWMGDFEPVSIRMAKSQNLSLNPTKISGCCGRLMCCLKFEDYLYEKPKGKVKKVRREKIEAPQVGTMVATSLGNGKVTTVNKAKHTATVQLTPDNVVTLEWSEIMDLDKAQADAD
jgi:cell fate regulator YaaT (PSP1 superfamily)